MLMLLFTLAVVLNESTESLCCAVQKEASEVFFSVTKLYQSKDANLRRMVYLVIKDVCPGSDEVIIITSSLMKDMNSKTDLYRSNAIRVLCSITDSQLLGQIERYLKQVTHHLNYSPATLNVVCGRFLEDDFEFDRHQLAQLTHGAECRLLWIRLRWWQVLCLSAPCICSQTMQRL
jgi:hypothetical protein